MFHSFKKEAAESQHEPRRLSLAGPILKLVMERI